MTNLYLKEAETKLRDLCLELVAIHENVQQYGWEHYRDELECQSGTIQSILTMLDAEGVDDLTGLVPTKEKEVYKLELGGHVYPVELEETTYHNGNFALLAMDAESGEAVCTISVNGDGKREPRHFFVKDWSENEGVRDFLIENKLAAPTGRMEQFGFCVAEEFVMISKLD